MISVFGDKTDRVFERYAQEMYLMQGITARYRDFLGPFKIYHTENIKDGGIEIAVKCGNGKKYIGNSMDAVLYAIEIGYCSTLPYTERKLREINGEWCSGMIVKHGMYMYDESETDVIRCTENFQYQGAKDIRFK